MLNIFFPVMVEGYGHEIEEEIFCEAVKFGMSEVSVWSCVIKFDQKWSCVKWVCVHHTVQNNNWILNGQCVPIKCKLSQNFTGQ